MSQEQYSNHGGTTLSAAMDATQTSLPITSAAGLPGRPQYRVRVDDEIMLVTGGAGTLTQTVVRGAEGTAAATHATGAPVNHVLTEGSAQNLLFPRYHGGVGLAGRGRNSIYLQDDFLSGGTGVGNVGSLGWAFAGFTTTFIVSEANRPGIARFTTAATNPSTGGVYSRSGAAIATILGNQPFDLYAVIRPHVNAGAMTASLWRVGLSPDHSHTGTPADAMYFEKLAADVNWFAVTRAGGAETRTNTGIGVTSNAWYLMRIRREVVNGPVIFNINDGADISHTTNLTAVAMQMGATARTTEAVAKIIDLDYYDLLITGLNR